MKEILGTARSRRRQWWSLMMHGSQRPLDWSLCSTRQEARELRDEYAQKNPTVPLRVVRVRVVVELE